jgi:hypothetical protein
MDMERSDTEDFQSKYYPTRVAAFVAEMLRGEARWRERILAAMPVGWTWCEHEPKTIETDLHNFRREVGGHYLPSGYVCDVRPSVRYGPKPDEAREEGRPNATEPA